MAARAKPRCRNGRSLALGLSLTCARSALTAAALLVAQVPATRAQPGRLASRLEDLNVRVETEHYALAGTVSESTLEEYGQALEFIYREYARGFDSLLKEKDEGGASGAAAQSRSKSSGRTKSGQGAVRRSAGVGGKGGSSASNAMSDPNETRFRVLVFATEAEYHDFGQEYLRGRTEHTNGLYIPALQVLLITYQGNADEAYALLFHEAFHQFLHRYVADAPVWLDEGLATYYGGARLDGGRLRYDEPPGAPWKLVRKLIAREQFIPLTQLVQARRAEFYDATPLHVSGYDRLVRRHAYYAQSYTLVHLLLTDTSGRERLQHYVRALAHARGKDTARVTAEYFGPEACAHMTPYWIAHVQNRPENQ